MAVLENITAVLIIGFLDSLYAHREDCVSCKRLCLCYWRKTVTNSRIERMNNPGDHIDKEAQEGYPCPRAREENV